MIKKLFAIIFIALVAFVLISYNLWIEATALERQNSMLSILWLIEDFESEAGSLPDMKNVNYQPLLNAIDRHGEMHNSSKVHYKKISDRTFELEEIEEGKVWLFGWDRIIYEKNIGKLIWEKKKDRIEHKYYGPITE